MLRIGKEISVRKMLMDRSHQGIDLEGNLVGIEDLEASDLGTKPEVIIPEIQADDQDSPLT